MDPANTSASESSSSNEGASSSGESTPQGGRALSPQEEVESLISGLERERDAEINALPKPDKRSSQNFKVKVDGEEIEVGLDELIRGYSRQSDYTKKTQSLKAQRDALELQKKSLLESDAYKAIQKLADEEEAPFDPLDPDAVTKRIRANIAKELRNMYQPVEEAYATEAAKVKVTSFIESKPEFQDLTFKKEVYTLLKADDSNLDLQTAYEIVSARRIRAEHDALKREASIHKKMLADAGLKVGTGSAGRDSGEIPEGVRRQGAYAIAEFLAKKKGSW